MELWMMIAIGAAVAACIVVAAMLLMRSKRLASEKQTIRLQQGFGPEYARAFGEQGRSAAEADLLKREQVADLFKVRPLSAVEVTRYSEAWTATQAQFVTNPGGALSAADHLVGEVITACGYPAADFEQGANALSVDHPRAVQDYRAAHEVVTSNQKNPVQTDSLRVAMMQYQAVFAELMNAGGGAPSVHAA